MRANYVLAVFWAYIAAFVVAFLSIFVFPPAALGLVFVGALLLIPAVIAGKLVRVASRMADRPYLRRRVCPVCRAALPAEAASVEASASADPASAVAPSDKCSACGAAYDARGYWLPDA